GRLKKFEKLTERVVEWSVEAFQPKRSPERGPAHSRRVCLQNLVQPEGEAVQADEPNSQSDGHQEDSDRGRKPVAREQPLSAAGRSHRHDYLSAVKIYPWTRSSHRLWTI